MTLTNIITAFLLFATPATTFCSGFEGKWKVLEVEFFDKTSSWSLESVLPSQLEVHMQGGHLAARFTEKNGFTCPYSNAFEVIEGNEMVLMGCRPIKSPTIYSPLHRVKLIGDLIEAVVITDKPIYKWTAKRVK
jgi:hypothetical protein